MGEWYAGLCELNAETFEALLPILRRAFSSFQAPERRKMGEKVKHLHTTTSTAGGLDTIIDIDTTRANTVLPILAQLMGGMSNGN